MTEGVTLIEQAYAVIRQDILSGKLAPDSPLRIDRLKDSYAIGASPLREALSRLLTDGLVTSEGLRGFRVAPASLADFRDITDVRKIMESAALKVAIEKGNQDWEGKLVVAHYQLSKRSKQNPTSKKSLEELERLNRSFHVALIEGGKSPHLIRLCMHLYDLSRRYREISMYGNPKRLANVEEEHDTIFAAALSRNAQRAMKLLSDHIEETYQSVSKAFVKATATSAKPPAKRGLDRRKNGGATVKAKKTSSLTNGR